jgi:hypothetical protein
MTATRSEVIAKAQGKIEQASTDSYWSYENWNDFYHTACEMVHKELVDADLGYFRSTATLSGTGGVYPLPSDCHIVLSVKDANGRLYSRDLLEEDESEITGYTVEGENVRLVEYASPPDTVDIRYIQKVKEIGEWTGTADADTADYKQGAPLNTKSAERLLSEVVAALARVKDESLTSEKLSVVDGMISRFVDRLGTRIQDEPFIMGLQSY